MFYNASLSSVAQYDPPEPCQAIKSPAPNASPEPRVIAPGWRKFEMLEEEVQEENTTDDV